jgi:hypothetical protein
MADRLIHVSWGQNFPGREAHGLEIFNEALGMYGRMQQDGTIEKFDVVLLAPTAGGAQGYINVYGTAQQLAELRESDEFLRNITDASLVVQDLAIADGYCNEGVARQVEIFQESISKVPA